MNIYLKSYLELLPLINEESEIIFNSGILFSHSFGNKTIVKDILKHHQFHQLNNIMREIYGNMRGYTYKILDPEYSFLYDPFKTICKEHRDKLANKYMLNYQKRVTETLYNKTKDKYEKEIRESIWHLLTLKADDYQLLITVIFLYNDQHDPVVIQVSQHSNLNCIQRFINWYNTTTTPVEKKYFSSSYPYKEIHSVKFHGSNTVKRLLNLNMIND